MSTILVCTWLAELEVILRMIVTRQSLATKRITNINYAFVYVLSPCVCVCTHKDIMTSANGHPRANTKNNNGYFDCLIQHDLYQVLVHVKHI